MRYLTSRWATIATAVLCLLLLVDCNSGSSSNSSTEPTPTPGQSFGGRPNAGSVGSQAIANAVLDLNVLVIARGNTAEDPGLALIADMLDNMDVPYTILDASRETLTASVLFSGTQGFYHGIILTESVLFNPAGGSHFTLEEWQVLQDYERMFGVRESVISGFPSTDPTLGIDYGMAAVEAAASFNGMWLPPAGGTEFFEYVNGATNLPIDAFGFVATPRSTTPSDTDIWVTPLLADAGDPNRALVSIIHYPDAREVLIATLSNAWYLIHSQVLAYEFLNFATKGVFIGARKVYLAGHIDDFFMPNALWNPDTNQTDNTLIFRMSEDDLDATIRAQDNFNNTHATVNNFALDLAFNGEGAALPPAPASPSVTPSTTASLPITTSDDDDDASPPGSGSPPGNGSPPGSSPDDGLTRAVIANKDKFRFINHTYSHLNMNVSAGTTYDQALLDIVENRNVWQQLGLPEFDDGRETLVSGDHSGLRDNNLTPDPQDDIPYPEGKNDEFLRAAQDAGVRYLASDSSQINQDVQAYVPGFDIVLLPRRPSALFYNITTPQAWTDEYNYIYYERYLEMGLDPCAIPGAICSPRTYQEILTAEAEWTLRYLLTFRDWAFFFHQANLSDYDQQGATLLFDWLEAVVSAYEQVFSLPILNLPYNELGERAANRIGANNANLHGAWDVAANTVTLSSDASATVQMTGVSGGSLYGGQRLADIEIAPAETLTLNVDRALNE